MDRDIRTGARDGPRDRRPDIAGGTGDQSRPTLE
jgi:hypothetical protein